jgi:DHA2 family multidrug resistance protein-like MFS transporter
VVASGFVLAALGSAVLALLGGQGLLAIVAGSVIISFGLAPVIILATDLVVGAAPPERAGSASALSETSTELGGALGIAVLGSVITSVYRGKLESLSSPGLPAGVIENAKDSLAEALKVAETLSPQTSLSLIEHARAAFSEGVYISAGLATLLCLAAAAISGVLLRPRVNHAIVQEEK